jgi:hypothetical protein
MATDSLFVDLLDGVILQFAGGLPVAIANENGSSFLTSGPYLKASLPTAIGIGQPIYVSNATGAHVIGSLCFWNGTSWIDTTTGVAVV